MILPIHWRHPPLHAFTKPPHGYFRTGVRRDGAPLKPPMGFDFHKNIDGGEIAALIAYLRSLKPQPLGGG